MIRCNKICLVIFLMLSGLGSQAQEYLTGLQTNDRIARKYQKWQQIYKSQKTAESSEIMCSLPFFDDFRNLSVYPDSSKWVGKSAFVNNSFCYLPPDYGVATFDAMDSTGNVYATASSTPTIADVLISQPIRLDSILSSSEALSPADSVYLSFYYQPQGVGNAPEAADSLVLAFKYPTGDSVFQASDNSWQPTYVWKTVWKSPGMDLQTFRNLYGRNFVQVMIPIREATLFYKGFQFCFFNYVSIADNNTPSWKTNTDEWNLDFVYLNANRSAGDTTYQKLRFSGTHPSFVKHYTSMPYAQYRSDPTNSTNPSFHVNIANLDKVSHDGKYQYNVTQEGGNFAYSYDGGTNTLQPFSQFGFEDCGTSASAAQACPPVNSLFSLNYDQDTASYLIKQYITDPTSPTIQGDSMVYKQVFYHYFSYDDGTPEQGYGIEPAGAMVACQFKMNTPDSLTAIQFYFNKPQASSNSLIYFNLKVWSDNNGKPGDVIYEQDNQQVHWSQDLYGFYTYQLSTPVLVSGVFYVGLQQQQEDVNIGFDANDDAQSKIFYSVNSSWYQTRFNGALMIRPVIGKNIVLATENHPVKNEVGVYPNPAANSISFSGLNIQAGNPVRVEIFDVLGNKISSQMLGQNHLSTQYLSNGFYFARIYVHGKTYCVKFVVRK